MKSSFTTIRMSDRSSLALLCGCIITVLLGPLPISADEKDQEPEQRPLNTLLVTRSLTHEKLLPYLEEARPQIVQIGNFGAMFHGFADNEKSTGWPMQLPVAGERAALDYQQKLNERVHKLGLTVVGHFRLIKVVGNWEQQTGFVEYYNRRWPKDLLGEKPHSELRELLARGADGQPIQLGRSGQDQLALCLSSPYARSMLKSMLKVAVDRGVDGVMSNYNYRYDCTCPHCQAAFKSWLGRRFNADQLRAKLKIENLEEHTFASIPAGIPGYPAEDAGELEWLAKRWGAEHFKQMFDEIFIDYGRSLKRDLLVGQWNHLSHVSIAEERMFTPLETWGRGEDYFWYSGGAAFVGKNLSLKEGRAGDAWLSCLYVREMSGDKPFVMGKYDRVRMQASMAEGFATGGMGMGRYMRFEEPEGYAELARYTKFRHDRDELFKNAARYADAALVLPRQSVLNRQRESLDAFRDLGQALVERQALIDVVADQKMTPERLKQYPSVILPSVASLSDDQLAMLQDYVVAGGQLITTGPIATMNEKGEPRPQAAIAGKTAVISDTVAQAADSVAALMQAAGGSRIDTHWTVRAAAYEQTDRVVLHLVNYNRQADAPEANRTGPVTELPQAVENVAVRLRLPAKKQAKSVTLYAPENQAAVELPFKMQEGRAVFEVPRLFVYGVVAVKTTPR